MNLVQFSCFALYELARIAFQCDYNHRIICIETIRNFRSGYFGIQQPFFIRTAQFQARRRVASISILRYVRQRLLPHVVSCTLTFFKICSTISFRIIWCGLKAVPSFTEVFSFGRKRRNGGSSCSRKRDEMQPVISVVSLQDSDVWCCLL